MAKSTSKKSAKPASKKSAKEKSAPPCGVTYWIWWPRRCDTPVQRCRWRRLMNCCERPCRPVKPPRNGRHRFEVVATLCSSGHHVASKALKIPEEGTDCDGYCEYDGTGQRICNGCTGGDTCPESVTGIPGINSIALCEQPEPMTKKKRKR